MNVTPIFGEHIAIGEVPALSPRSWMMLVIEADAKDGDEAYCELYPSRDAAIAAAETSEMPIRFINEPGTIDETRELLLGNDND